MSRRSIQTCLFDVLPPVATNDLKPEHPAVWRSQLLSRWRGTHSRILSGIPRAAQTVLGVYLKRTRSRDSAHSCIQRIMGSNDNALCQSTHSLAYATQWRPNCRISHRARINNWPHFFQLCYSLSCSGDFTISVGYS